MSSIIDLYDVLSVQTVHSLMTYIEAIRQSQ